eukprot:scaffold60014_cov74-Cyclotella_meneghiniana.AAC.2
MARSNKPSKKTNKKKRRRSSSSSSDDSASSEDAAAAVRGNPPFNIHPNQLSRAVRHAFNYIYPNIEALKIAADYREGSLIAGNIRQPGQGNLLVSIVQNYDLSRLRLFCDVCKKLYKHNSFNAHLNKCIEKNPFGEDAPMIRNTVNRKRKRIKADPRKRSTPSTEEYESPPKRQKRSSGRVNYREDDAEMDEGDVQLEEELSSSEEVDFGDSSDSDSEGGGETAKAIVVHNKGKGRKHINKGNASDSACIAPRPAENNATPNVDHLHHGPARIPATQTIGGLVSIRMAETFWELELDNIKAIWQPQGKSNEDDSDIVEVSATMEDPTEPTFEIVRSF